MTREDRRVLLDALEKLNQSSFESFGDPETKTRISQYEMAYRMQTAVPELMDIRDEPQSIHDMYGTKPGAESFANNCLLARRMIERGVRFVQLYDWGWDSHGAAKDEAINFGFQKKCTDIDKPIAALLKDLKQRGLLEDTLVVWTGEFGAHPCEKIVGDNNAICGPRPQPRSIHALDGRSRCQERDHLR